MINKVGKGKEVNDSWINHTSHIKSMSCSAGEPDEKNVTYGVNKKVTFLI